MRLVKSSADFVTPLVPAKLTTNVSHPLPADVSPEPNYWPTFFNGGEQYKGWHIIKRGAIWYRWNGWTLGHAISLADSKLAIDIEQGDK